MHFIETPTLYWKPPSRTGDGAYIWERPAEILAKWDYKSSIIYTDNGAMTLANAAVWVECKVELGGYMWKGSLKEVTKFSQPEPDVDFTYNEYHLASQSLMDLDVLSLAVNIKAVEDIPPLRRSGDRYLRKALVS